MTKKTKLAGETTTEQFLIWQYTTVYKFAINCCNLLALNQKDKKGKKSTFGRKKRTGSGS